MPESGELTPPNHGGASRCTEPSANYPTATWWWPRHTSGNAWPSSEPSSEPSPTSRSFCLPENLRGPRRGDLSCRHRTAEPVRVSRRLRRTRTGSHRTVPPFLDATRRVAQHGGAPPRAFPFQRVRLALFAPKLYQVPCFGWLLEAQDPPSCHRSMLVRLRSGIW